MSNMLFGYQTQLCTNNRDEKANSAILVDRRQNNLRRQILSWAIILYSIGEKHGVH